MTNLTARIERHRRLRKRMRWHIDHLRRAAGEVVALPVRSSRREECDLARAVGRLLEPAAPRFGASDCECPTHLYYARSDPLDTRPFHDLLQAFRMRPPS